MNWSDIADSVDLEAFDIKSRARMPVASVLTLRELGHILTRGAVPLELSHDGLPLGLKVDNGRPLLFPSEINDRIRDGKIDIRLSDVQDPLLQYFYLAIVKNAGGEHNASLDDIWYRRHLHRAAKLLEGAKGVTLDVGSDDPALSALLFPPAVSYIGLDPGLGRRSCLCIAGMAEFLPFRSECVDNVAFLTSLDHILDYHAAIDEAYRVLRPGGKIFLATLLWSSKAELARDTIHFHHFRDFEIQGVLARFKLETATRYNWKNDRHRCGLYLSATKPGV